MDLNRQHLISLGISRNLEKSLFGSSTNSLLEGEFSNSLGYGWYPNTRTTIHAGLDLTYHYTKYLTTFGQLTKKDVHDIDLGISGQFNYFLNYNTRLTISASADYMTNSAGSFLIFQGQVIFLDNGNDRITGTLNASLSVFLF